MEKVIVGIDGILDSGLNVGPYKNPESNMHHSASLN